MEQLVKRIICGFLGKKVVMIRIQDWFCQMKRVLLFIKCPWTVPWFTQISTWCLEKKKKKIFEHDGKIRAYDTVLVLKLINDIFYSLSLWPVQNIIKDSNKSIIAMAV